MLAAVTTPSPSDSMYAVLGSSVSLSFIIARLLMFIIISVTSSFTPGIELSSCLIPSILTVVTAADGKTVYLKYVLSYASYIKDDQAGGWVKGTKNGNTITVPAGPMFFWTPP